MKDLFTFLLLLLIISTISQAQLMPRKLRASRPETPKAEFDVSTSGLIDLSTTPKPTTLKPTTAETTTTEQIAIELITTEPTTAESIDPFETSEAVLCNKTAELFTELRIEGNNRMDWCVTFGWYYELPAATAFCPWKEYYYADD